MSTSSWRAADLRVVSCDLPTESCHAVRENKPTYLLYHRLSLAVFSEGLSRSEVPPFAYSECLEEIQVKCGRKATKFLWRKRIGAGVPGVQARHIPHCLIFVRCELISYHVLLYPQVCINILLLILNANSHRVYSVTQP